MLKSKVAQALSAVVLKPLGSGESIRIDEASVIGRSNRCQVVIADSGVSRQHAKLVPGKLEVVVQDLGSVNGTYINDERISGRATAKHEDTIRFDTLAYRVLIIEDDDDDALIDNTRPPKRGRPAGVPPEKEDDEFGFASTRALSSDDLAVINDTNKPSSPPAEKRTSVVAGEHPFSMTADDLKIVDYEPESREIQLAQSINKPAKRKSAAPAAKKRKPQPQQKEKAPSNWALEDNRRGGGSSRMKPKDTVQMDVVGDYSVEEGGAVLVGLTGPVKGRNFSFGARDVLTKWEIGRAENSEVHINDASVSRNHAQLVNDKGRWKLIDLMSANGTYVNGNKCLTSYLESGDSVRFGKQEFMFKASGDQFDYDDDEGGSGRRTDLWIVAAFAVIVGAVLIGFFSNSF